MFPTHRILKTDVAVASYESAADLISSWAGRRASKMVCFCNVHMTVTAHDSASFQEVLRSADLVLPDGMPLVWLQRLAGLRDASRVASTDLAQRLFRVAASEDLRVGLYGGSPRTLDALPPAIRAIEPSIEIAYAFSPPFRALTDDEDRAVVDEINRSGTQILFVGLGCPKQEEWMARHRDSIHAVMLGVGATFDWLAGTLPRAPRWMRDFGLEWAFRLGTDPRRLWYRYMSTNPRFLWLAGRQAIAGSSGRKANS